MTWWPDTVCGRPCKGKATSKVNWFRIVNRRGNRLTYTSTWNIFRTLIRRHRAKDCGLKRNKNGENFTLISMLRTEKSVWVIKTFFSCRKAKFSVRGAKIFLSLGRMCAWTFPLTFSTSRFCRIIFHQRLNFAVVPLRSGVNLIDINVFKSSSSSFAWKSQKAVHV